MTGGGVRLGSTLDPVSGELLWRSRSSVYSGIHLTPVVKCDGNHLYVASQFSSGGARLLNISTDGGRFVVKELWFKSKLRASCWTRITIGDYIYGSAGGHKVSIFTAFNWRTGKTAWRKRGHHMVQCLYADGRLIMLDQNGSLSMATVTPDEFNVFGSVKITDPVPIGGEALAVPDPLSFIFSVDLDSNMASLRAVRREPEPPKSRL